MNLQDICIDKEINVLLSPKNEAEQPELVLVKVLQQIPSENSFVFIGTLQQQTKQDFGYRVGELLIVKTIIENDKVSAFCTQSLQEASIF
jgi:hypothetical protein